MSKTWAPQFTKNDFQIIQEKNVYSGYCPVKEYQIKYKLFEGGWSKSLVRELVIRPQAAAVLLYDPIKDKIVLVEQLRIGALHLPDSPWILEIVAGLIDENETPTLAAHREALEESGCTIQKLIPVMQYLVTPGISDEKVHIFCGIISTPETGRCHGVVEDGEDIKMHVFDTQDVFDLLNTGQIQNAPTIIALQWLQLNLTRSFW